ncbi:MAG: choice-of-anchor Q domain-containing protein, partial [Candidatus Woesearchaeota archaeon]
APVGGNGMSWSTAWNNFSVINWSRIQPGDTIYISGGTTEKVYEAENPLFSVLASGAPGNRIKITKGVDPGHNGNVKIRGTLEINSKKHIEVFNLSFIPRINPGASILIVGRSNYSVQDIVIRNNFINSSGQGMHITGWNKYFYSSLVDNVNISGNTIIIDIVNDAQTDGIYMHYVQNIFIEDNYMNIYNNNSRHNDLIQTAHHANNITLARNVLIHRSRRTAHPENKDNGLMMTGLNGIIKIHNNVIARPYDDGRLGIIADIEGGDLRTCYFNITGDETTICPYNYTPIIYFYNNILITDVSGNGVTIIGANRNYSNMVSPLSEVKNNVFHCFRCNSTVGISFLIPPQNIDYNLYSMNSPWILNYGGGKTMAGLRSIGAELHGVEARAVFVNPDIFDYRLAPNSPGIDQGAVLSNEFRRSLNGVLRPQGSGWDIGAFEFVSGSSCSLADVDCNGCISFVEISVFVNRWLNGQVSFSDVNNAIIAWLNGGC